MSAGLSLPREAAISFVINALLSLTFFLATFGLAARPLAWAMPDRLALDFLPQSIAVALMSGLVPALLVRRRLAPGTALRPILSRAGLFACGGAALGTALALASSSLSSPLTWPSALMTKLFYGGALGAFVTFLALRPMASLRPSR